MYWARETKTWHIVSEIEEDPAVDPATDEEVEPRSWRAKTMCEASILAPIGPIFGAEHHAGLGKGELPDTKRDGTLLCIRCVPFA